MRPLLLALLSVAATTAWAQDERAGLLAAPAWLDEPMSPRFVEMEPNELRDALKVVATRYSGEADFNAPQIQLELPLVDNSTYAEVEIGEPRLIGNDGRSVECEVRRPPHDVANQVVGIRLVRADGQGPVEFARAVGEATLRYPLAIETRTVFPGQADAVARIDGPYVEIVEGVLAEAPSLSPLEPIRGYDAEGRQLRTAPFPSMRMREGRTLRRIAFRGAVARVELDRVVRAADVTVRFDVPAAEPLSKLRYGLPPEDVRGVFPHPSTRLAVSVRASEAEIPLPPPVPDPTPRPTPPPTPEPVPVAPPADAPTSDAPPVAIPDRDALSPEAQALARGLDALQAALERPASLVSLVAYPPAMVTLSVARGDGTAEGWTWREGELYGPRDVDVSGLECRSGLAPGALRLARLPALHDDAVRRVGPGQTAAKIVIGQRPCGTPETRVTLSGGARVVYTGDGRLVAVESE